MKNTELQERAIMSPPRQIIPIIAGPGSGKTHVLVARAMMEAALVGTDAVAVCAFTRSAAAELVRRMDAYTTGMPAWCGTVHGLASDILYHNPLYEKHRILDEATATMTLERIASEQGFREVSKAKQWISEVTKELAGFAARTFRLIPERTLAQRYCSELLSAGYTDYDMLLALATGWLDSGAKHGIKVVLVDEFQDISESEAAFLSALRCRLVVVGDPNQAIFGFKGGDSTIFNDLCLSWQPHLLNQSFRCPPAICDAANCLVGDNQRIESYCEYSGSASFYASECLHDCESALQRLVSKNPVSTAILCRYNDEVEYVTKLLEDADIPCCCKSQPIEEKAINTFRLLVDIDNEFAAYAFVADRFGAAFAKTSLTAAKGLGVTLNRHMKLAEHSLTSSAAVHWMKQSCGGRHDLYSLESVKAIEAIVNDENSVGLTGPQIAELLSAGRPHKPSMSAVNVLTIHAAKGLEFQNVIVAQLMKATSNSQANRNLLYVAFTRASRTLTVLCNGKPAGPLALESFQTRFVPAEQALPIAE